MPWDERDPDGPPAWWVARCHRADARRPLCDEYGTPADDDSDEADEADEADSDGSADDGCAPEGDSGDGGEG